MKNSLMLSFQNIYILAKQVLFEIVSKTHWAEI